ncbi:MAG: hypothetical protein Tsb0010_18680 [Parvularculaceae bacterium]
MSQSKPIFSVIIIAYDMAREVPRTVASFLPPYQERIEAGDVEIIVMENGSSRPIPVETVAKFPDSVRYVRVADPQPSPARALNEGVALASGEWVCPVIDGARLASPGVLRKARELAGACKEPVIATVGLHLGLEPQQISVRKGYNQEAEDRMLAKANWMANGYRLFDIACFGGSAKDGWFGAIAESNALLMRKSHYERIGGYDERFDIPGGGILNLDFFKRATEHELSTYYLLMGEGTFHQHHGGVTTSKPVSEKSDSDQTKTVWQTYAEQYFQIRGVSYEQPSVRPILYGDIDQRAVAPVRNICMRMGMRRFKEIHGKLPIQGD